MNKTTAISIVLSVALVGLSLWAVSLKSPGATGTVPPKAVIENGKQVIDITAKGGYSPRVVSAKAGVPTVLRVYTSGTFDCSASLVIPKLSYQQFLQPSGMEEISISADQAKGTLQGLCAMGMYNFQIRFE